MLEVRVLGPIDVRTDDGVVRIGSRTQRLVLAALARDPGQPVSRDRLSDLIWGDAPPDSAPSSLKSHMSRLRAVLGRGDVLAARAGGYALILPAAHIDARRFEHHLRDTSTVAELASALELWRGRPFGEFADHPYFAAHTAHLCELYVHARQRHARMLGCAHRVDQAVAALEALVAEEPLREPAWIDLLEVLVAAGRRGEAAAGVRRYREHMAEVGLDPSERFVAAERRVFAAPSGQQARGQQVDRATSRLPPRLVEMVGRDDHLAHVTDLLEDRRIVSLVGPGGVGKTTLAVEAGHAVDEHFPDGVWLVALADVDTPDAVVPAIARAVGAPTTEPLDRALRDYLSGHQALLVLDNAEHVREAAAATTRDLAAAAPEMRFLITSRRPVGLPGEAVVQVPPLDRQAAVGLLRQRARDAGVSIPLDQEELAAQVCDRLDRLPLALEMAAARLRGLNLEELAARLGHRLGLLRSGGTGRHQTLREVVAWSYDLLSPAEQSLLAQLSVFAGPFDLGTAETVCRVDGDVAGSIADLCDCSLLQADLRPSGSRYHVLETVRQFAAEQLAQSPEADAVGARFVRHHAGVMEAIAVGLGGSDEADWARRFEDQLANLGAAHRRASRMGDHDSAARLAAASYAVVYQRLQADVGGWAEATLPALARTDHPLQTAVAAVVALNRLHRDEPDAAAALLTDLPDTAEARHAHEVLADLHLYRGDLERAAHHARRAGDLAEAAGDQFTALFSCVTRGLASGYAGRTDEGLRLVDSCRPELAVLGSPLLAAWFDYAHAELVADEDPATALALLDQVVAAADDAGWSLLAGVGRLTASSVRARTADPNDALPAFSRLIDHWDRLGDETHQWTTLRNLIELLTSFGAHAAAVRLLGAVSTAPVPTYGSEQRRLRQAAARLRTQLGQEEYDRRFRAARHMSQEEATALARRTILQLSS